MTSSEVGAPAAGADDSYAMLDHNVNGGRGHRRHSSIVRRHVRRRLRRMLSYMVITTTIHNSVMDMVLTVRYHGHKLPCKAAQLTQVTEGQRSSCQLTSAERREADGRERKESGTVNGQSARTAACDLREVSREKRARRENEARAPDDRRSAAAKHRAVQRRATVAR